MKTSKILLALAIPAVLASCSKEPELPYDLQGTVHSFAVSVSKSTQHDLLLNAGSADGDFYVKLDVPQYMGDFTSYLKEVQLLCVYTAVNGDVSSAIAAEGITTIPSEVKIDMAALCDKLGIAAPAIGDKMQFTANIVHKDGTVVPGWSSTMGFNNRVPSFLRMSDGSAFSYCATYTAAAPLNQEKFAGGNNVLFTESKGSAGQTSYPAAVTKLATSEIPEDVVATGFTAEDYIGLKLEFTWYGICGVEFYIFINKKDYSVVIPEQLAAETEAGDAMDIAMEAEGSGGEVWFYNASAELNTQTNILSFKMNAEWDITSGSYAGYYVSFNSDTYEIDFSTSL